MRPGPVRAACAAVLAVSVVASALLGLAAHANSGGSRRLTGATAIWQHDGASAAVASAAVHRALKVSIEPDRPSQTVPFDETLKLGSPDIPASQLAKTTPGCDAPEQVSVCAMQGVGVDWYIQASVSLHCWVSALLPCPFLLPCTWTSPMPPPHTRISSPHTHPRCTSPTGPPPPSSSPGQPAMRLSPRK